MDHPCYASNWWIGEHHFERIQEVLLYESRMVSDTGDAVHRACYMAGVSLQW